MGDMSGIAAAILLSLQGVLPGAEVMPPRMIALTPEALQIRVCGRPCNVLAWYAPHGTIYIDHRMDPETHLGHRSILIHELVHHVQRMTTGFHAASCDDWRAREYRAYAAQGFWLQSQGLSSGTLALQARFLRCDDRRSSYESAAPRTGAPAHEETCARNALDDSPCF